jgi:hypothetical protein
LIELNFGLDTEDADGEPLLYGLDSRFGTEVFKAGPASRMQLWRRLVQDDVPKNVWCLNLQYDLVNLLGESMLNSVQPFCAKKRVVGARIRGASHVRFFGIERFLPKMTLEELGEAVGVKKFDLPFEDPRRVSRDAKIARVVGERILKTLDKLEIPLRYSAASGLVARLEEVTGSKLPPPHPVSVDYGREALYGGRTETYFLGEAKSTEKEKLFYFDFNKAYGRAMLEDLPDYSQCYQTRRPAEEMYIADCTVRVREILPGIAPLPHHLKKFGLCFPKGEFRGTWTSIDLEQEGVEVLKYHHVLNFPLKGAFLKPVTAPLLKVSPSESKIEKALKKNLYTSLSGKFSQSQDFTIFVHVSNARDEDHWKGVAFGEWILVERKGPLPRHANFVWSAFIQARCRIWQNGLFKSIVRFGGRPLYGDTDSGLALLPSARAARAVQEAQEVPTKRLNLIEAQTLGPKVYRLVEENGTVHLSTKGVPRRLITESVLLGEETILGEVPDSFFHVLKGAYSASTLKNRWKKKKFNFRRHSSNRHWNHKNNWTAPLTLSGGKVILHSRNGGGRVA